MKRLSLIILCILGVSFSVKCQEFKISKDAIQTVLENNHLKVIEYASMPGKDICGKGRHSHPPHLSILLTDAVVTVTTEDGKTQQFDVKAGTVFWSEAETHEAINNGSKPAKAYLVELK